MFNINNPTDGDVVEASHPDHDGSASWVYIERQGIWTCVCCNRKVLGSTLSDIRYLGSLSDHSSSSDARRLG